jgi:ethanolamine ammonia-lyase small subunit
MSPRPDSWWDLARLTPARIALGRTGASLPTREVLQFALAHAKARDAVGMPLDNEALVASLALLGLAVIEVHSAAPDRAAYLGRPDLGRQLDGEGRERLQNGQAKGFDVAIVIADGLSTAGVQAHVAPLIEALLPQIEAWGWSLAPLVVAHQARVAIGDEVGDLLGARLVILLVGERPGLSSPDSLGAYLTFQPRPGRSDAERNCVSNIHGAGLSYGAAAHKILWLASEGLRLGLTGVDLKDRSEGQAALAHTTAQDSVGAPAELPK